MNCIYGVIYFLIVVFAPITMAVFYRKKRNKLFQPKFRYKYGGGYDGIKEPMSIDGQLELSKRSFVSCIVMPLIFVGRRFIFAFSVIFFASDGIQMLLPIPISFYATGFSLGFLINAMPYEKSKDNYMDMFNEVTLLFLMCVLLGFTAWMPVIDIDDSIIKFVLGWIFVGVLFTNIIVHFIIMVLETFKVSCKFTVKTVKKV